MSDFEGETMDEFTNNSLILNLSNTLFCHVTDLMKMAVNTEYNRRELYRFKFQDGYKML